VLGLDAAAEVPALVSTLLRARIEGLPPDARRVLDVLAVCGGAAEQVLLDDVTGGLINGITGLRFAGLVVEDTRDGSLWYRVAHPVLAEAAYDMVPLGVRRRLHAGLARAVERHRPDDVRLLAVHIRGAGDQIDAVHALGVLTAATRAELDRRAGDEACASARAGLDLARRLGRREIVDELSGAYAEACELAGRVDDALPAWLEAASSASGPRGRAHRLTRAAVVTWELGRFTDAYAHLAAASGALADTPPGPEHIDVEEVRVRFAGRAGDYADLETILARLTDLERMTTSRRPRAVKLLARLGLAIYGGRYVDGLTVADDVVAVTRDDELMLVGEALLRPLTLVHLCWGDSVGARASAEYGIRLARQAGVPAFEVLHGTLLAVVDVFAGDWSAALRRTLDDLDLAQRIGTARGAALALAAQGLVLVRRGQVDDAAGRVGDARRLFGRWSVADRHVFAMVDLVDGMVALARHDLDRALNIATRNAVHNPTIPPLALALLGEAQAAAGDIAGALDTASQLAGLGPGAPYPTALAAWIAGLAAGARRDPAGAVAALGQLDDAIAGFADLGMRYEAAIARVDRARVRRAGGYDADGIARDVDEALHVLDDLGAKPQADRARAALLAAGGGPDVLEFGARGPGDLVRRWSDRAARGAGAADGASHRGRRRVHRGSGDW
jgi:hypothetical protein